MISPPRSASVRRPRPPRNDHVIGPFIGVGARSAGGGETKPSSRERPPAPRPEDAPERSVSCLDFLQVWTRQSEPRVVRPPFGDRRRPVGVES